MTAEIINRNQMDKEHKFYIEIVGVGIVIYLFVIGWMERKPKEKMDGLKVEKGVDDVMTANRGEWKGMTCCTDPK